MSEDNTQLKKILEGVLLAAGEALSLQKLQSLFDEEDVPDKSVILTCLEEIKSGCEAHGFDLVEVASGWRFQVREDLAPWVNRLWEEKPQKYSRALLETLALIAYRQPITRGDIEEVRGVAVSSHIIKTLMERDWVKVVGHRDVPGRPSLYATTKSFLDYFGLKSLDELPTLGELKDIDSINQNLDFDITGASAEGARDIASIPESANDEGNPPEDVSDQDQTNELGAPGKTASASDEDSAWPEEDSEKTQAEASEQESSVPGRSVHHDE